MLCDYVLVRYDAPGRATRGKAATCGGSREFPNPINSFLMFLLNIYFLEHCVT